MARLLLFAATTGYQIRVFEEAARRLGVDLTLATDRCHVLEDPWGDRAIPVRFGDVAGSLEVLRGRHFDAVAAVGDSPAVLAAEAASEMGIPFHPPGAVRACHDKFVARRLFAGAGLLVPEFFRVAIGDGADGAAHRAPYPCVLKPLGLSASRGVIRANHAEEFRAAFARIKALLAREQEQRDYLQVEAYIPGREFAVEGLMTRGEARILAIFDKPDPLEGPFFEETIYVTPSRESEAAQQACGRRLSWRCARWACITGRSTLSCAGTRAAPGCWKWRRGRLAGSVRRLCASARACLWRNCCCGMR